MTKFRVIFELVARGLVWGTLATILLAWIGFEAQARAILAEVQDTPSTGVAILAVIAVLFAVHWQRIATTVRLYTKSNTPFVVFIVAIVLLIAAMGGLPAIFGEHPLRWASASILTYLTGALISISWSSSRTMVPLPDKSSFISDNPHMEDGTLTSSQEQAFHNLEDLIIKSDVQSIALVGEWGSGKTRIICALRKSLEKHKDVIVVEFKPWPYASEEALVQGFYLSIRQKLSSSLGVADITLNSIMAPVQKFVDKNDQTGLLSIIGAHLQQRMDTKESPEDRIRQILKREGRRLLIVIDDIERSYDAKMLYRSLQLAQHARAIEFVQIVTVFEKDAVLRSRPSHAEPSEEYLEKFFEIEVLVPNSGPDDLEEYMRSHDTEPPILPDYMSDRLLTSIKTHRGAIRTMNEVIQQFSFWSQISGRSRQLSNFKSMIDRGDLLAITFIKLKFPRLFADIEQRRALYTQEKFPSEGYFERALISEKEDEEKKNHFEALFSSMGLSVQEREHLGMLLAEVFPEIAQALGDSTRNVDYADMRISKRIGLRSILDAYFGKTSSLTIVQEREAEAEKVITAMSSSRSTSKGLSQAFKRYYKYLRGQEGSWGDAASVLFNEMYHNKKFKDSRKKLIIAAMQVVASSKLAPKRADLVVMSNVFEIAERMSGGLSERARLALLEEIFSDSIFEQYMANPMVAAYLARMDMSNSAKLIARTLRSGSLKPMIEQSALAFLENYFISGKDADMLVDGDDYIYLWETWVRLAEVHDPQASFVNYFKGKQEMLLNYLVKKSDGEYVLTDGARFSGGVLIGRISKLVDMEALRNPELKRKYQFLENAGQGMRDEQ